MEWVDVILKLCGGVSIVGGALTIIWKLLTPALSYKKRIEKLEHDTAKDYSSIKELKEMSVALCKAQIAMIDHELTGNHVDGLKKVKAELVDELAKISTE